MATVISSPATYCSVGAFFANEVVYEISDTTDFIELSLFVEPFGSSAFLLTNLRKRKIAGVARFDVSQILRQSGLFDESPPGGSSFRYGLKFWTNLDTTAKFAFLASQKNSSNLADYYNINSLTPATQDLSRQKKYFVGHQNFFTMLGDASIQMVGITSAAAGFSPIYPARSLANLDALFAQIEVGQSFSLNYVNPFGDITRKIRDYKVIKPSCPNIQIGWYNELGGFDTYVFEATPRITPKTFEQSEFFSSANRQAYDLTKTYQLEYSFLANVDASDYDSILDMFFSKNVFIYKNESWVRIQITSDAPAVVLSESRIKIQVRFLTEVANV